MQEIELKYVPPMSTDEDAYLVRIKGLPDWKRMTRSEIEKEFPNTFKKSEDK